MKLRTDFPIEVVVTQLPYGSGYIARYRHHGSLNHSVRGWGVDEEAARAELAKLTPYELTAAAQPKGA